MKESDIQFIEKLLLPIKESLNNVATKESLLNLPTKSDLNSELQQLFESVTIHVGEELAKRDAKFESELKIRDDRISNLEQKMDEIIKQEKKFPSSDKPQQPSVYVPQKFQSEDRAREDIDVCLIGDSLIRHIDLEKINPNGPNKMLCKPGGKIGDVRDQLKSVSGDNVKRLILCTGTNHIPSEKPSEIATQLVNLVRDAKLNLPDTQVFVSAILPKYGKSCANGNNFINRKLFEASKFYNFDLIFNLQFQVNGFQNDSLYAMDGLHLNKRGVARLAMNFKYRLNKFSTSD